MVDLKQRELKMKERRKHTPWRDFVKEICSRRALPFYKIDGFVSRFPETERIGKVVSHKEFAEQRDNLVAYGLVYDDKETFFTQLQRLFTSIPLENTLLFGNCENSDYADQSMDAKNTYLSYSIIGSENVLYTILANGGCNIFDSMSVVQSENIYQSHSVVNSYNIFYSKQVDNSRDIWFCTNMVGCQECMFCQDLDNTSYCIHNIQYSKDAYIAEKKKILSQKTWFAKSFEQLSPGATISLSTNATWKYITDCSDVTNGYYVQATHQSHNAIFVAGWEGCKMLHDVYAVAGAPWWYNYYGIMWCTWWDNVYSSVIVPRCMNTYYSYGMESCSYCLGCVGLKNKSFCILNTQYTKEERFELVDKIFTQMESDWVLWTFFPWWMNPFYFNDTVAYLIDDSFTKEEVIQDGYLRRDEEIKTDIPANTEVIETTDLNKYQWLDDNGERKLNSEILKKVIKDEKWNYYRIVQMELGFLQKHWLPLPDIHRLERIKLGFKFK